MCRQSGTIQDTVQHATTQRCKHRVPMQSLGRVARQQTMRAGGNTLKDVSVWGLRARLACLPTPAVAMRSPPGLHCTSQTMSACARRPLLPGRLGCWNAATSRSERPSPPPEASPSPDRASAPSGNSSASPQSSRPCAASAAGGANRDLLLACCALASVSGPAALASSGNPVAEDCWLLGSTHAPGLSAAC